MAWAAMPVFFFGVVLMRGFVLLSLRDSWVAWVAVPVFLFFKAFGGQLSPLVSSGLIWWHGLPCPFLLHVRPIRFPPTDSFHFQTAVTGCHALFFFMFNQFGSSNRFFPFPDGSVEPSMCPRNCLELS